MDQKEPPCVIRARKLIQGQRPLRYTRVMRLANELAKVFRFDYARVLVANYRRDLQRGTLPAAELERVGAKERLKLAHRHSLYTYKDPDIPAELRLDLAMQILDEADPLERSTSQETLSQAGAILKRRWEIDGQRIHLESALGYYDRARRLGIAADDGYASVNAAFVHDLLAAQEPATVPASGVASRTSRRHRRSADGIRREVVEALETKRGVAAGASAAAAGDGDRKALKWLFASLAEAYYGLGRYADARQALHDFAASEPEGWERETAARQLARLYFLRSDDARLPGGDAWQALAPLLGSDPEVIRAAFVGKVGLALSGGGFRASLFHLGVLARLAELHLLRYVEVLSCVSGGSIVGAHYYLALKQLLERNPGAALTRHDYVELVERVAGSFLAGIQHNLRMRLVTSPWANLKMAFWPGYSHTDRAGELFEQFLYRDAARPTKSGLYMDDLLVRPYGPGKPFNPRRDNWQRADKVPILALNATTLNTGRNWQFTATWMGESPADLGRGVDGNAWLRRLSYAHAPENHRRVRLGFAVAASACVPALFRPLDRGGLYPGWLVRLVDGGVHDNQGIATLLDQECTLVLVSDASGQSPSEPHPRSDALGVPLRANDILMARVRQEQYRRLDALERAGRLRGLMFVHLRSGLRQEAVDWEGCQEKAEYFLDYGYPEAGSTPAVPPDIQGLLAAIRTDLDSFSDAEAYALMTSGYRHAERNLPAALTTFADRRPAAPWFFLDVEPSFFATGNAPDAGHEHLKKILATASGRALKVFRLSRVAQAAVAPLVVAALAVLAPGVLRWWPAVLTLPASGVLAFVAAAGMTALLWSLGGARIRDALLLVPRATLGVTLAVAGWLPAWLYVQTFDRLYLRSGRVLRRERRTTAISEPVAVQTEPVL